MLVKEFWQVVEVKAVGICKCKRGKITLLWTIYLGPRKRVKFSSSNSSTKDKLGYTHFDLWGLIRNPSINGSRYFVSFIDKHSRKKRVYPLKNKNKMFGKFRDNKTQMEVQTSSNERYLRNDNVLKLCNDQINKYYNEQGIIRNRIVAYTCQ